MNSLEGFTQTLRTLKESGAVKFPLGSTTADGNFMFRTIYSLKLTNALTVLQDWTNEELQSTYTDYPSSAALFTSGEVAMMINGVWEVPTMLDLHKDGKLFDRELLDFQSSLTNLHHILTATFFAIPVGKELTLEKRSTVLKVFR